MPKRDNKGLFSDAEEKITTPGKKRRSKSKGSVSSAKSSKESPKNPDAYGIRGATPGLSHAMEGLKFDDEPADKRLTGQTFAQVAATTKPRWADMLDEVLGSKSESKESPDLVYRIDRLMTSEIAAGRAKKSGATPVPGPMSEKRSFFVRLGYECAKRCDHRNAEAKKAGTPVEVFDMSEMFIMEDWALYTAMEPLFKKYSELFDFSKDGVHRASKSDTKLRAEFKTGVDLYPGAKLHALTQCVDSGKTGRALLFLKEIANYTRSLRIAIQQAEVAVTSGRPVKKISSTRDPIDAEKKNRALLAGAEARLSMGEEEVAALSLATSAKACMNMRLCGAAHEISKKIAPTQEFGQLKTKAFTAVFGNHFGHMVHSIDTILSTSFIAKGLPKELFEVDPKRVLRDDTNFDHLRLPQGFSSRNAKNPPRLLVPGGDLKMSPDARTAGNFINESFSGAKRAVLKKVGDKVDQAVRTTACLQVKSAYAKLMGCADKDARDEAIGEFFALKEQDERDKVFSKAEKKLEDAEADLPSFSDILGDMASKTDIVVFDINDDGESTWSTSEKTDEVIAAIREDLEMNEETLEHFKCILRPFFAWKFDRNQADEVPKTDDRSGSRRSKKPDSRDSRKGKGRGKHKEKR